MTTTDRIKKLEARINEARASYYNNEPSISDKVFDAYVDELRTLDPNNKAVTAVGAPVAPSEWKKAKHQIPMGSLDKVNTPEELIKWISSAAPNEELFVVEKLDGISIEVVYENGKLIQAITRGDGYIGEDITVNVVKMAGVVSKLKDDFTGSLRGEIIMRKSIHKKFFADKANPRNAASGLAKRLDGVGVEHLNIVFYQALSDIEFETEHQQLEWLRKYNLDVPNFWTFKSVIKVNEFWRLYQDTDRNNLDYEIDGLVVRINNLTKQLALGDKDMRPKGAKAFKFDNEARESVIRAIVWQVGNSGRLTPVAIVDPIILVGATVTRASLYNLAYVEELGLDIGTIVLVARANDIIPRVEEVIKSTGTIAKPPTKCPECNGEVLMVGENITCLNTILCPAQVVGRIANWIKELNLLEWGDAIISRVVESGKVTTVADLYTLTVEDLMTIERMGKRSATKCYDILHANMEVPLDILLGALSIPMIGGPTIRAIMVTGCDSLEKFQAATDFKSVAGVGSIRGQSLLDGLKKNKQLIANLLKNGIKVKGKIMGNLSGKSFCFTGAMVNKRTELEKMVTEAGGEVKSSVGKSCTYLVISDINSTSSKAVSARKIGTLLISEEDFLNLLK